MPEEDRMTEILAAAARLEAEGRFGATRRYLQHGRVTVYDHCLAVAAMSLLLAERLHLRVDRAALLRGALLHDYFLYDWHIPDPAHRLHGFTHPAAALRNASADWPLSETERDIIAHHMFPLTLVPPHCREAWLVCLADKLCAARETAEGALGKK